MARPPPRDVDILVHVAAPSAAADDARHRRLAAAYLAFEPASRTAVSGPAARAPEPTSSGDARDDALDDAWDDAGDGALNDAGSGDVGFCGPESQDLSFRSAWDNRASPRRLPPPAPAPAPGPAPELATLASQVSDSYPLPDAGLMTATPSRVLQHYLAHDAPDPSPTSAATSSSPQPPGSDVHIVDVPSSLPVPQPRAAGVVPVTPAAPPCRRSADDAAASVLLDVTHISSSFVSHQATSSPSRAASEQLPWPCKRPRLSAGSGRGISPVSARSTSDAGPAPDDDDNGDVDDDDDDDDGALEIRPPSPPAGVAHVDPAALVSDKLAKLARDLSSRYRPEPAARALEPLERGYWLLDTAAWPSQRRRDTWVFLTNYLRSGLAGWGVWCRRAAGDARWIRLYCWACVAKHTYLLLYLASARHVKATGAAWYDADGRVALEVPPRAAAGASDAAR